MQVEFLYNIKDELAIKPLNVIGFVIGLYFGETGIQYQVSYFSDGAKKTTFLYEEQLREPTENDLGFL